MIPPEATTTIGKTVIVESSVFWKYITALLSLSSTENLVCRLDLVSVKFFIYPLDVISAKNSILRYCRFGEEIGMPPYRLRLGDAICMSSFSDAASFQSGDFMILVLPVNFGPEYKLNFGAANQILIPLYIFWCRYINLDAAIQI